MALRDELKFHARRSGGVCAVAIMLQSAGKQKEEIVELINDHTVPSSVLVRLLQSHGFTIKDHSVTRHRRKECTCEHA
jgi:hypothetical protein